MQTNDVGMDQFMTLCKVMGVEPYITVNAGFGDAHSAAEEVQYMWSARRSETMERGSPGTPRA